MVSMAWTDILVKMGVKGHQGKILRKVKDICCKIL